MESMRNAVNMKKEIPVGRCRHGSKGNIKMDVKVTVCGLVDCLLQGGNK
jgi:hypothetical protein